MLTKFYIAAISGLPTPVGLPQPGADSNAFTSVLSIVIETIAIISLLFIVIGGLRYILSRGDPQAVAKAKGTILYAIVGLVIAISAQAIVSFVLVRSTS